MTLSFFLLFISLNIFGYQREAASKNTLPNIILINVDDMGWRDTGFMGSQFYETPNLDLLASKGVIFNQAYAAAANCAPSRACMMSGENTPRHGVYTVANSDRGKSENRKLVPTVNNQSTNDDYLTDLVMDKTLDFLANNQEQPFFLNYSPYAVHTPIQPVADLLEKYLGKSPSNGQSDAKYATMVENLDRNIGRKHLYLFRYRQWWPF